MMSVSNLLCCGLVCACARAGALVTTAAVTLGIVTLDEGPTFVNADTAPPSEEETVVGATSGGVPGL